MTSDNTLLTFFSNEKGELPSFIKGVDDYVHVKMIYLQGKLDRSVSEEMEYFFIKAKKDPGLLNKDILLDFRKVEEIDTAVIAELLKILALLKKKQHRMGIFNVPERMMSQMEILKVDNLFQIFSSNTEALKEVLRWSAEWK
jgi:anti-anti-sigma regulatory factor